MKTEDSQTSGHSQDQEKGEDYTYEENGYVHGFKPLSSHSETIRESAILLQKSDDEEQLKFF